MNFLRQGFQLYITPIWRIIRLHTQLHQPSLQNKSRAPRKIDIFVFTCFYSMFFHTAIMSYYCNTVGWTWWNWSLILRTYLSSVLWPVKTRPQYDLCVWWDVKPCPIQSKTQKKNSSRLINKTRIKRTMTHRRSMVVGIVVWRLR